MIVSTLKWFGLFVLFLVLQTTFVPVIGVGGIKPDLLVLGLFLLAIRTGVMPGLYVGFLLGLGQDIYSPSILGQNALSKTVMGFFVGLFNERFMRTDPVLKLIILFLAFILHDTVFTIVLVVKTEADMSILPTELITRTLPRALYSSFFAALIYLWDYFVNPSIKH
ncbi:MAG: rod shape-determining protein MreD [Fibrobacterota bacterium]